MPPVKKPRPRSRAPPARLEWPSHPTVAVAVAAAGRALTIPPASNNVAGSNRSTSVDPPRTSRPISSFFNKSIEDKNGKKKRTRVTFDGGGGGLSTSTTSSALLRGRAPATSDKYDTGDALWTEAHAPTTVESVCVAPKKVQEISQWLAGSSDEEGNASNGSGLLVIVGSPGIGKSTLVRLLARQNGFNVHEWSESVSSSFGAHYHPDVLSQPTPLDSFEAFLRQSRAGYSSVVAVDEHRPHLTPPSKKERIQRSVILLEEIPNLHGAEMEERFRHLFATHVQESTGRPTRTILIWSHVTEGKHHRDDLERLLPPRTLYDSRHVHIVQVHPPTKARFGKVVDSIARQRGIRSVDAASLYEESGGDLRFAITTLQFEGDGARTRAWGLDRPGRQRDERLNPMHALGKLLYAKRIDAGHAPTALPATIPSRWHDSRSRLAYEPDDVLDRCEMELPGALQFLAYHSVDFMMDVEELSNALERYSDAAWLLEARGSRPHATAASTQVLVSNMACSVASRAVSTFNLHPAPSKFRQLSKPRSYDAVRKRTENQSMLKSFLSREVASLECVDQYATDSLAFVRRIQPDAAPPMESFVGSSSTRAGRFGEHVHESDEQVPIPTFLEGDDIGEFSDSDDALHWAQMASEHKLPRLSLQLTASGCQPTPTTVATSPASSSGTADETN